MWKTIMNLSMQLIGKNLSVKIFHADFEKAAHTTVLQIFSQCKIVCCDSEIGHWLKYFFGLPYFKL